MSNGNLMGCVMYHVFASYEVRFIPTLLIFENLENTKIIDLKCGFLEQISVFSCIFMVQFYVYFKWITLIVHFSRGSLYYRFLNFLQILPDLIKHF